MLRNQRFEPVMRSRAVSTKRPRTHRRSAPQRLFALLLGCNVVLIVWDIHVVPAAATLNGLATTLATVGMQVAIACLALVGPFSFQRYRTSSGSALVFGVLFAAAYLGLLGFEFADIQLSFDTGASTIYALFVGAAVGAGAWASARTRRLRDGVVAGVWALVIGTAIWSTGLLLLNYSLWGSQQWYQFWLGDGAIDDFRHSGSSDLAVFLLQDLQGALFFHPILSAVIGTIGGTLGGGLALAPVIVRRLWRRRRTGKHGDMSQGDANSMIA